MNGPEVTTLALGVRRDESSDADEALVAAALSEPAAFGLLYERYYERVYRYCRSRAPTHEESADLTQQVFVQAFHNLRRYRRKGSSFAAWLFRIARNLSIDASRRRRHETVPIDECAGVADIEAHESGPEETAIRNEELARLRLAVEALPPAQRDTLVLRFAVGLSIREIAAVTGNSVSATQMRLWRTLQAIRKDR